ncbi:TonB family protein [Sulfuriflexus sp.]|uniref:energy transducer TonB n=1 Tax=Sulfuriflexus sp. TaxID=2015443 RepID=UPI0028CD7085|nr:TonB family protein [Sulfuriflexus sp.]MDT8402995.1 TonB family protein [Sulfuriflexus sp.]
MTKTISILFLASAALHAAVLGLVSFEQPARLQAGSPFTVSIQASSPASSGQHLEALKTPIETVTTAVTVNDIVPPGPVPDDLKTPKQKLQQQAEGPPQPHKLDTHRQRPTALPEATSQTAIKTAAISSQHSIALSSEQSLSLTAKTASLMQANLQQAFALQFHYPRLAIRHGWQGEVRLGLRIEANGRLSRVRVVQGSGYGLLDDAAIKSLNKVAILPQAIALLNGNSMDLILPVRYELL